MKIQKKISFLLLIICLTSCKNDSYVLYPIDNACDSITITNTSFNNYKFANKYISLDAEIIKSNDSVKILELNRGPEAKVNKLIISKNNFAVYPGLIDGSEFVVKKINDKIKPISNSHWGLLKNCNSKLERFRNFDFNKELELFYFEAYGNKYGFTYKTKDSINYQLFFKTLKVDSLEKYSYDPNFVSAEFQLLANNLIRAKFYGLKLKDNPEITYFNSDSSNPETVYFFKYNK